MLRNARPLFVTVVLSFCVATSASSQRPLTSKYSRLAILHSAASQDDSPAKPSKDSDKKDNDRPLPKEKVHNPVLWQQPEDIATRDLFYGQGGEKHQPKPPFTFVTEDSHGTNPKFDARDADGKKWRVKLGEEARPEVVASRLLWAVGYYANDDYLLPETGISNLKLKRGSNWVQNGGHITDARFARKPGGQNKIGTWEWKNNPFYGTREFNGLRVMMALINNWDLKDVNNAVYYDSKNKQQVFLVSDVGATFATNTLSNTRAKDKGNVESFKNSKFITHVTDKEVDFGTPAPPTGLLVESFGFAAADYFKRHGFVWIGRNIPREDVVWITSLLQQLTHQQIADAFRAGHFPPEVADTYVMLIENRIQELRELQPLAPIPTAPSSGGAAN